jgi:acetyltransferase
MFRVSKACSIGNKCDVDEADLLEYLADDPQTDVVTLYLEGINDGRRVLAALDRFTARGNVVALMGGQTQTGAQTALSHTGSVASERTLSSGALRQRGVLEVHDFMELVDVAAALSILRIRRAGPRVGVLTFSGAAGVVTADLFERHGLTLAQLSPQTVERLAVIYPAWFDPTNPVDVWSTVELVGLKATLEASLRALVADENVDSVLLIPLAFPFFAADELDPMLEVAQVCDKPIVAWVFGEKDQLRVWSDRLAEAGIPVCRTLSTAISTLAALAIRDRALVRRQRLATSGRRAVRDHTLPSYWSQALEQGGPTIGEVDAKRILACYGIPRVDETLARSVGEATAAAVEMGYPVVAKLVGHGLAHKTELGGVRLGLESAEAVESAARELLAVAAREQLADPAVVVQRMVRGGLELIVGARRDPRFGPVVLVGLGGVFVEALGDVAVRPAPLTADDARDMIAELRSAAVLEGGRGRAPADVAAIVDALLALSHAILDAPEAVGEIEVNPLIVRGLGEGACAVDALIVLRGERGPVHAADRAGRQPTMEARCPS